ncbi:MAG: ferritin-like domain-containing protein [Bryobacteraceae bacterium]
MDREEKREKAASRRSFLQSGITAGVAAAGSGFLAEQIAFGESGGGRPSPGDVAILSFLAAVELVEDDLWGQYCLLAVKNDGFNRALRNIDPSPVRYNCDIRRDERSHALFINAYLKSIGEEPTNLDPFRTIRMPQVMGADDCRHLANLTSLTVDTSWYLKYRTPSNPDLGATPRQLVKIVDRPGIPTHDHLSDEQFQAIANTATFHSPSIEQGGVSLYDYFTTKATNLDVLAILASILPVEATYFTGFRKSLETLPGVFVDGLVSQTCEAKGISVKEFFQCRARS